MRSIRPEISHPEIHHPEISHPEIHPRAGGPPTRRPRPLLGSYTFQTEENIFLVMDLVGGGDLYQLLDAKKRLPEPWVTIYAAEVSLALQHVHAHDVIFRDLVYV